jgi:chemotaxis protein CheX
VKPGQVLQLGGATTVGRLLGVPWSADSTGRRVTRSGPASRCSTLRINSKYQLMTEPFEQVETLTCESVREVFQSMLSMELSPAPPVPMEPDPDGQIVGSVGFIGNISGVIHLTGGARFARVITSRMLGIREDEVEGTEMVNDAMGELSNMVVGYVKSRLCDRGWTCTLTIPSIVRGQQLSIEGPTQTLRKVLAFRSGEFQLLAELLLKEPTGAEQ